VLKIDGDIKTTCMWCVYDCVQRQYSGIFEKHATQADDSNSQSRWTQ